MATSEMKVEVKGNKLVIELPMSDNPAPSSTGKTLLVASTHGNIPTSVTVKGKPLIIGVTAYIKAT